MMNRGATQKPELILKRANDIVNLGTGSSEKEKRIALELLHSAISIKKKSAWSKSYDALMRRHVELCVDVKDHATAKDGMHQYRNLCIHAEPLSLEGIILYLIELGERKLVDAKRRSNQASIAANARSADLEQEESPESIVLSSMTEDGTNDRTYREMVVPWLKFVWEIYRAAVELLSRIPKLDKTYHDISRRAFQFCQDNNRRTEFRRLCEMLRTQLENIQKPPQIGILKSAKPQWEWTSDLVEMYMQTKFEQLDKATAMDLWNEAFRTIEDISKILAKKAAKTKSLATYYEKLTKIFWVADNKLFHAYALLKLFSISTLKGEDKQILASAVLLAAMSVPPTATMTTATSASALGLTDERDAEEYQVDRNADLAALLDFHSVNPTRQSLVQEIAQRQVAAAAFPELADLFTSMEVEFSPIKLSKKIAPAVTVLRNVAQTQSATAVFVLQQYAAPLERNIVVRYMQQLAKAYSQVKIDYVMKALSGLVVLSRMQIERVLVDAVRARHLSLRVSHVEGSITFSNTATSLQAVDSQVYHLGQVLSRAQETVRNVMLHVTEEEKTKQIQSRRDYFHQVENAYDELYFDLMERSHVIEKRKEDYELLLIHKEEARRKAEEEEEIRIKKEIQIAIATKLREEEDEKRRKEMEEQEIIRIYAELRRLGFPRDQSEITAMTVEERKNTLKDAEEAYRKSKDEEKKRLEIQAKSFDYRVRAERLESFTCNDRVRTRCAEEDAHLREAATAAMHVRWSVEHAKQLLEKERLSKIQPYRTSFEQFFREQQLAAYEHMREQEVQRQLKRLRDVQLVAARKLAAEEKEKNAEEARRRAIAEEERRLEVMRAEVMRAERQREEQAQRDAEERAERMRREVAEAEERKKLEAPATPTPPPVNNTGFNNRDRERTRPPVAAANIEEGPWRRPGAAGGSGGGGSGAYAPPVRAASRREDDGGDAWRRPGTSGGAGGNGGGGFRDRSDRGGDRNNNNDRDRNNNDRDRNFNDRERSDRGGDRERSDRDRPPPRSGGGGGAGGARAEGSWR